MKVESFFHAATGTLTYVVFDEQTLDALIIDPVLDFDLHSGRVWKDSLTRLVAFLEQGNLSPKMILETHVHADHLSASAFLKQQFPEAKIGISREVIEVQKTFYERFGKNFVSVSRDPFDLLFDDGDTILCGSYEGTVLSTPGHTPACVSFLIEDMLFTGDTIFMPDVGTGRCDFPSGCPKKLYHSIKTKIYSLPASTKIFVGHDYQPQDRDLSYCSSVEEQLEKNIHINKQTVLEQFVQMRTERDEKLSTPRLLYPSLQVNLSGGQFLNVSEKGCGWLMIPVNLAF